MEPSAPAILELGVLLLAAAAAGWVARRAGLPAVVGYLVIGVAVSPFTPGFAANREQLELLANIGVVLLLFEVGIEIDLWRLRREQRALLWIAPLQVVITTVIGTAGALLAGLSLAGAGILGLAVALSSSVVIVNITRSRRRTTDRATEEALLGWSVVQDVTGVVVAAILISLLGGSGDVSGGSPATVALGLLIFIGLALAAAWALPRILRVLHEERDTFLIVSVASGLAIAGAGALAFHIPMALAAFIAGLTITESHHAQEARRRLLPFRDLFAVLFFVVIGTLIDPVELARGWTWFLGLLALLVVGKVAVVYGLARAAKIPARPGQVAVGLGQIGEFSFVLASLGVAAGELQRPLFAAILAAVAVSIAISSVAVRYVVPKPVAT
jgi:CPA2 family monovalent cation:H+ antiporter-2